MRTQRPTLILILLVLSFTLGCNKAKSEADILNAFKDYFEAVKTKSDAQWNYTVDTVKVWFEKADMVPSLKYKGEKMSKWGEWDKVMNSKSYYDSIWYNKRLHAVQGYFFEDNDFYDLIGASPNKTLRTYSLNEEDKITDLLYERQRTENAISDAQIDPIYEWALKNDSLEITELYPKKQFVPSAKNALRWKTLIKKYKEQTGR
ncbi:MAG TPA: hypothetical protein VJ945_03165 [Flavobacteriaceae bacterium]|nr:hypothetical protein [Flavobacteriaceae bacterium]